MNTTYEERKGRNTMQKGIIWLACTVSLVVLWCCLSGLGSISAETRSTVGGFIVLLYFIAGASRLLCYVFYAKKDASILKLFIATRTQAEFDEYKQDVQKQYYIAAKEAEREIAKETASRC